jgi:hypothetical protein
MEALRARRYSTLLYYLVYHPILWHLSRFRGWHVLHGSAVTTSDRHAAVFAGMPGCGKSTLSVAMLADGDRNMLSDNLVLFDDSRVRACPEVLLLDAGSLQRVGGAAKRLVSTGERRVYERNAYRPDNVEVAPCMPAAMFCVERAKQTAIEAIDSDQCLRAALAGNSLAKEVRRISMMGDVLDLIAGTDRPDERADLVSLLRSLPCYRLQVGQGDELARVIADYVLPACNAGRATASPVAGRGQA